MSAFSWVAFAVAQAHPEYRDRIPNGHRVTDCEGNNWAGVGHLRSSGGGPRNPFGADFAAAGKSWTPTLCALDSDGDGKSNGVELGDPSCTWTPGTTPQFDVGITHPGLVCGCTSSEAAPTGCANYSAPTTGSVNMTFAGHNVGHGTSYIKGAFTWTDPAAAVLRFEFINNNPNVVHHMILYRCPGDMSSQYGTPTTGSTMGCNSVLMAWAVGGGPFCAPEGLGFRVDSSAPYFLLEIHYDNPQNVDGIVDTSGIQLQYVPSAGSGTQEANVVLIGARLPLISIPPQQTSYQATVTLSSSLFSEVEIFAVIEHMHGIGRKIWMSSVDTASNTTDISCNTAYDFDLQEAKYLPSKYAVQTGGNITINCVYNSSTRTAITHGGDATEDEMCIVAIMYRGPPSPTLLSDDVVLHSGSGDKVCGGGCNSQSASSSDAYDYDRGIRMLKLHGWLMFYAWGLVLPAGMLIPRFWRSVIGDRWLYVHMGLQLTGLALVYVGFYAAVDAMDALLLPHFNASVADGHKVMGLVIVIIVSLQLLAFVRPHVAAPGERPTLLRTMWSWSHRIGGLITFILAIVNVQSGIARIKTYVPGTFEDSQRNYFIILAAVAVFGIVGLVLTMRMQRGRREGDVKDIPMGPLRAKLSPLRENEVHDKVTDL